MADINPPMACSTTPSGGLGVMVRGNRDSLYVRLPWAMANVARSGGSHSRSWPQLTQATTAVEGKMCQDSKEDRQSIHRRRLRMSLGAGNNGRAARSAG